MLFAGYRPVDSDFFAGTAAGFADGIGGKAVTDQYLTKEFTSVLFRFLRHAKRGFFE